MAEAKYPRSGPGRGARGNIVLELALLLPVFLLLIAGIIDLGLLFWEMQVLTNATREGARAATRAVVSGAPERTQDQVKNVVCAYLFNFNLRNAEGSPLVSQTTPPPNDTYTLNAGTCNYTWVSGTPIQLTIDLTNIPVKMMLLPNVQSIWGGGSRTDTIMLNSRTTMAAEWTTPPS